MSYYIFAIGLTKIDITMFGSHRISSIEERSGWVYLFDESGKRYQTLSSSSVGTILGYSSSFIVSTKSGWIYTWDKNGNRISTRAAR